MGQVALQESVCIFFLSKQSQPHLGAANPICQKKPWEPVFLIFLIFLILFAKKLPRKLLELPVVPKVHFKLIYSSSQNSFIPIGKPWKWKTPSSQPYSGCHKQKLSLTEISKVFLFLDLCSLKSDNAM